MTTSAGPRFSVIVPSYKRPDSLKACLDGLASQLYEPVEIIVVLRPDDVESMAAVSKALPTARVVKTDSPGQVAALNRGLEATNAEFIAITDDDAVPRPDWLQAIARRFATDQRIGAVGGRDVVHHGADIEVGDADRVGRISWWGRRIGNHHLCAGLQDVHFLKGANMSFRVAAIRPFDDRLRGVGAQVHNDLEATWSVKRRGWRVVYDPSIVVDHYPAARHGSDGRDFRPLHAECDAEHNEVYALLRHAAPWHGLVLLAYRLLVGTRRAPGLVRAAGGSTRSWSEVRQLTRARLRALGTLRVSATSHGRRLRAHD